MSDLNINVIRVKTKSTTVFVWSGYGPHGHDDNEVEGLREAVTAGLDSLCAYLRGNGRNDGVVACLVTWEDGDVLRAFLHKVADEVPAELPWTLARTKPRRVLRQVTR